MGANFIIKIASVSRAFYNYFLGVFPYVSWALACYTCAMDKQKLLALLTRESVMIWDTLCELYPSLVCYDPPKIELNPYTWRTAGLCFQDENRIQLGYKFFKAKTEYRNYMIDVILPHEIIHQADWFLYGESEKKCGHGENWQKIMVQYGLDPDPFHSMEIPRK